MTTSIQYKSGRTEELPYDSNPKASILALPIRTGPGPGDYELKHFRRVKVIKPGGKIGWIFKEE